MPTVTIYPITVEWMDGNNVTTVSVATTNYFGTGHFSTPQTNRALLDFDITALGSDFIVNSATLQLTVNTNFLGTSHTLQIYRVRRLWRHGNAPQGSWTNWRQDHSPGVPSAPTLTPAASGGTWTVQTAWVIVTYVDAKGESLGSSAASAAVVANGTLTITSPASSQGATSWYAYVGTGASQPANTAMYRQQAAGSPTAIGTNLVLTANPTTTGANPPASDTAQAPWTSPGASDTTADRDSVLLGSLAITSATTGTVSIPLTASMIQEWVNGTWPNYGIVIQASDEVDTTLMRWDTMDAIAANKPQLVIDYTPSSHTLTEGVVAYFKLDDTAYLDASGNGHTLTEHGTPTVVAGELNGAAGMVAASSQYLSNPDAALKLGNVDWTWCGWVKLTDTNVLYAVAAIGGDGTGEGGGMKLFYHEKTILDYFVAQLYNDQYLSDPVISDVISFSAGHPPVDTWLFIAVRHDSARKWYQIFCDYGSGLSTGDSATSHNDGGNYGPYPGYVNTGLVPTVPNTAWALGASNGGTAEYMNGAIDEVGLWGRWLSVTEIAAVRDAIKGGKSYPFTVSVAGSSGNPSWGRRRNVHQYADE